MSRKSLVGENLIVEVHYDLSCDGGEVGSHGCEDKECTKV